MNKKISKTKSKLLDLFAVLEDKREMYSDEQFGTFRSVLSKLRASDQAIKDILTIRAAHEKFEGIQNLNSLGVSEYSELDFPLEEQEFFWQLLQVLASQVFKHSRTEGEKRRELYAQLKRVESLKNFTHRERFDLDLNILFLLSGIKTRTRRGLMFSDLLDLYQAWLRHLNENNDPGHKPTTNEASQLLHRTTHLMFELTGASRPAIARRLLIVARDLEISQQFAKEHQYQLR